MYNILHFFIFSSFVRPQIGKHNYQCIERKAGNGVYEWFKMFKVIWGYIPIYKIRSQCTHYIILRFNLYVERKSLYKYGILINLYNNLGIISFYTSTRCYKSTTFVDNLTVLLESFERYLVSRTHRNNYSCVPTYSAILFLGTKYLSIFHGNYVCETYSAPNGIFV